MEPHTASLDSNRFDLRELSDGYYRSVRPFRLLFIVMTGVFVVILVDALFMLYTSRIGGQNWWTDVEAVLIAAVLIPPSLWSILTYFTRGPDLIELSSDAMVLRYRAGEVISVNWGQPSLHIRIDSFSPSTSNLILSAQSGTISLRGPGRKYTRINQDVSSAIVRHAEERGLRVKSSSFKRRDGTWNKVLISPPAQA